jgi:excisionase family DNA binding protein
MLPYEYMDKEYYSTVEAANILRVSRKTVFKWAQSGKIKATKVGRNYIIHNSAVLEELGKSIGTDKKANIEKAINKATKEYERTTNHIGHLIKKHLIDSPKL